MNCYLLVILTLFYFSFPLSSSFSEDLHPIFSLPFSQISMNIHKQLSLSHYSQ